MTEKGTRPFFGIQFFCVFIFGSVFLLHHVKDMAYKKVIARLFSKVVKKNKPAGSAVFMVCRAVKSGTAKTSFFLFFQNEALYTVVTEKEKRPLFPRIFILLPLFFFSFVIAHHPMSCTVRRDNNGRLDGPKRSR